MCSLSMSTTRQSTMIPAVFPLKAQCRSQGIWVLFFMAGVPKMRLSWGRVTACTRLFASLIVAGVFLNLTRHFWSFPKPCPAMIFPTMRSGICLILGQNLSRPWHGMAGTALFRESLVFRPIPPTVIPRRSRRCVTLWSATLTCLMVLFSGLLVANDMPRPMAGQLIQILNFSQEGGC